MGAIFDWEEAVWHTYKITQEEEEESTVYWIFPLVSNELFRDRLWPPPNFIDSLSFSLSTLVFSRCSLSLGGHSIPMATAKGKYKALLCSCLVSR